MASAAVDKGADELRREIDELHRQQREVMIHLLRLADLDVSVTDLQYHGWGVDWAQI